MASEYRQIHPRFWGSTRGMDAEVQRMALYILTAPGSNGAGIFELSCARAGEDLGLATPRCRTLVLGVCDTLNWRYDEGARVLYIPTWWRWNCPHNTSHMVGCLKRLESLPQTTLLQEFASNEEHLKDAPAGVLDTFRRRVAHLATGCPTQNPNPNPDPYPNQNQKQNPNRAGPDLIEDLKSDRTGNQAFRQRFALNLCVAFGLKDAEAIRQKRAFVAVGRRIEKKGDRDAVAANLVREAKVKAAAGLDNPMAAWQKYVNKNYPKPSNGGQ